VCCNPKWQEESGVANPLRGREGEPGCRVKALLAHDNAAWCDLTVVELWNGARGRTEKAALQALESEVHL
jgi:hypothetical protein